MIPLLINDKKIQIPTNWKEITFKQYIKFLDLGETEFINAVALFTGISKDVWEKSKQIENFYIIIGALEFLQKDPKVIGAKNPKKVTIKGIEYDVPEGLFRVTASKVQGLVAARSPHTETSLCQRENLVSAFWL